MAQFRANKTDVGVRADIFIARRYPRYTRSSLEKLFKDRSVTIDGNPIRPSYKIKTTDRIAVDEQLINATPPKITLPVIYEDNNVIVINKPAGVLTHSKGALNTEATVASFIRPEVDSELEGNRAGIVHRLDRATSGVIIAAKNKNALNWLQKQFSARKTKKVYAALVDGVPEPNEAIIDLPVARNPRKPQTFYVSADGKPAQTYYQTIKSFTDKQRTCSLMLLKPRTGRTHQIRVHLAYIDHAVVGDAIYGKPGPHLMLHAKSLELTLPDRTRQTFEAGLPTYMEEFIPQ
ncbi:RluA family pseudouridine synthase [Candidatus Saccharibacteria bacterium]|nr:RluA family pseudouridine synthase [Candidatus Saccharibacteria bacterium]